MRTLLAVAALIAGMSAHAQEATSKAKQKDIIQKEQKENAPVIPSDTDIDNEITNAKLRAESGSKSKHSLSASLGYSGGSVNDAFGKTRPNISQGGVTPTRTSLSGDLSYRYRMTPKDSLTAGFGVAWTTPSYEGQRVEASNPGVGYSRAYKVGNVQNISSASVSKITDQQLVDKYKYDYSFGIGQTALTEIGQTGWQLGLAVDASYNNYTQYLEGEQTEYGVGVYPFVEYAFNDKYNFRTVFRGNTYESTRENPWAFQQIEPTQSMGLGIAATRDIFLYPNIQWVWRDWNADKTNVALSATMNFF